MNVELQGRDNPARLFSEGEGIFPKLKNEKVAWEFTHVIVIAVLSNFRQLYKLPSSFKDIVGSDLSSSGNFAGIFGANFKKYTKRSRREQVLLRV